MVLPAPVGPDDGDRLAGLDDEVEVVDERLVGDVPERDVLEVTPPAAGSVQQARHDRVRDLLGLVEQLEDALGGGDGGLEDVGDRGDLDDRERELARVLDERLHVAEAHLAVGDLDARR